LRDCANAGLLVFVTPSTVLRGIAMRLQGVLGTDQGVLLSCTKGIEHGTGMRMREILAEKFPTNPVAVLSGPNLAVEIARGLPSATVLGCRDESIAETLQATLGSSRFRVYTSHELIGIELGGALKNIFAIPAGVSDGFGFGDNQSRRLSLVRWRNPGKAGDGVTRALAKG
jgi:glycerol-3-phosphate dehydrogenase (NAD(P)+)